jgi:hypothetical protein
MSSCLYLRIEKKKRGTQEMERYRIRGAHLWLTIALVACSGASFAADIGGWYAEQQRVAAEAAAGPSPASCAEAIAQATSAPSGLSAYRAAVCYLTGDRVDIVAARAWLAASSESDFLPAQLLLRSLMVAEAGPHSSQRHCHDLGEGRQLCHGGSGAAR